MTTPISGKPQLAATAPTTAPPAAPKDQMGKDTFLKLLVAQLKYQNPMSPADGTEFLSQTAQFTVVEKLDALAKTNAELLSANRTLSASSLIGRSVVYEGPQGAPVTATVTGVRFDLAGPVLLTGSTEVPLAGVKEVRPVGP